MSKSEISTRNQGEKNTAYRQCYFKRKTMICIVGAKGKIKGPKDFMLLQEAINSLIEEIKNREEEQEVVMETAERNA